MSPNPFIEYDDSRFFRSTNNLSHQLHNILNHIRLTHSFVGVEDCVDAQINVLREILLKEHNASLYISEDIRIGKITVPACIAFETQTDCIMFMLRWS